MVCMIALEKLVFAQKYPFSSTAKDCIKKLDLSLNDLPKEVKDRAFLRLSYAVNKKQYIPEHIFGSEEFLKQEVLAFPVSKILVSFLKKEDWEKFAKNIAENTFYYLEKEKNKKQALLDLATDLNIEFELMPNESFLIKIPLIEFLSTISFSEKQLSLVNLPVEQGFVFLNENQFARFISQKAFSLTLNSLPVNVEGVPRELKQLAFSVKREFEARIEKEMLQASGKISPSLFPKCMQALYVSLMKGEKLSHMANFSLATFLLSIGMHPEEILSLYRKASNFNERIARYQIERLSGVKGRAYKAPNCEKIRSYGLCLDSSCRAKHPVSFYRRQLFALKKSKQTKGKESDIEHLKEIGNGKVRKR